MTGNIIKLPTAATTYYTIQRAGKRWAMVMVTPTAGKSLRTKLAWFHDRESAFAAAKITAAQMQCPFVERRGA